MSALPSINLYDSFHIEKTFLTPIVFRTVSMTKLFFFNCNTIRFWLCTVAFWPNRDTNDTRGERPQLLLLLDRKLWIKALNTARCRVANLSFHVGLPCPTHTTVIPHALCTFGITLAKSWTNVGWNKSTWKSSLLQSPALIACFSTCPLKVNSHYECKFC